MVRKHKDLMVCRHFSPNAFGCISLISCQVCSFSAPSLVVNVHITTEDDNEPDNIKIDEAAQFGFPKLVW